MTPTPRDDGQKQRRRERLNSRATAAAPTRNASLLARCRLILHQQRQRLMARRFWLVALCHLAVFALAYLTAFMLRFDLPIPADYLHLFWVSLPWILGDKLVIFFVLGHFDGWWAYVTFADLIALVRTSILAMLLFIAINYFQGASQLPRGILILDCGVTVVMLGALRGSRRMYRELFWPMFNQGNCRWALLVGTDHSHAVLAHQIQAHGELPYRIRGFLSTDEASEHSRLDRFPCWAI